MTTPPYTYTHLSMIILECECGSQPKFALKNMATLKLTCIIKSCLCKIIPVYVVGRYFICSKIFKS